MLLRKRAKEQADPLAGIMFYVGQLGTPRAAGEDRDTTGKIDGRIEGRRNSGQEGYCAV